MKFLVFCIAALAAILSPVTAKDYKLPKEKPVFGISFPQKWEVTHEDECITGVSADGGIQIYAQTDDAGTIEQSVKDCIDYLVEEGVKLELDTQKEEDGEHNGMPMGSIGWKGKDNDGPCSVSLIFLQVNEETTMTLIYWATDEKVKKHQKDILAVIGSMKSLSTKGKMAETPKKKKKKADEEEDEDEEEE